MNAAMLTGILRHILTIVGGYLVSTAKLDAATVAAMAGAIATLIGLGWSLYAKTGDITAIIKAGNDTIDPAPVAQFANFGAMGRGSMGRGSMKGNKMRVKKK